MANELPTKGTTRRSILGKGAFATGAAFAVAGMPNYRAFAQDTAAEGRIKQILDRGKILIGTGSTNPPWHFEDENGKLVGFDIEMCKILAGGLFGLDQAQILSDEEPRNYIEFVVHEADARIPDLLSDKVDINFQFMTVTASRALQVAFHHPVLSRRRDAASCPADSEYNSLGRTSRQGREHRDSGQRHRRRYDPSGRPRRERRAIRFCRRLGRSTRFWPCRRHRHRPLHWPVAVAQNPESTRPLRKAGMPRRMRHRSSRATRYGSISSMWCCMRQWSGSTSRSTSRRSRPTSARILLRRQLASQSNSSRARSGSYGCGGQLTRSYPCDQVSRHDLRSALGIHHR